MGLVDAIKAAGETVGKYAPQILTGLGIAGYTTAVIFAVDATAGAYNKIKME